ncbi:MAG: phosphoadenosine phosphosulfate reductase family protein [Candidatus Bathyarchaeia archaeon]
MVYWCLDCNVPLIAENCSSCRSRGVEVRLFRPEDPRPALNHDLNVLRDAVESEFGVGAFRKILCGGVILLNRVPYADVGYEVVGDGYILGDLFYDISLLKWRFKPVKVGCLKLVESGCMESVRVDGELIKGREIHSKVVDRGYVAIKDQNGEVVGVSEQMGNRLKILNLWKPLGGVENRRRSSLLDALKANEDALFSVESKGAASLYKRCKRFEWDVALSFSGGKDSLVSLNLALEANLEPVIVFTDTGVELPETVLNVYDVSSKFGLKSFEAEARDAFWKGFELYGPPARGYRWCCKTCKLIPTVKLYKNVFKGRVLTIVGQRAAESRARRKRGDIWVNYWIPNCLNMTPINDWTMLHVWLYIFYKKLESLVNPLYFKGLDRIGCYTCPYCNLAEFQDVKRLHPELWARLNEKIEEWAFKNGFNDDYVRFALWRWRKTPRRIEKLTGLSFKDVTRTSLKIELVEVDKDVLTLKLNSSIILDKILTLSPTIGGLEKTSENVLERKEGGVLVRLYSNGVVEAHGVEYFNLRPLIKVLSLVSRSTLCCRCGSCVYWCRKEAVKLVYDHISVDASRCDGCGLCTDKCPSAVYFIEENLQVLVKAVYRKN